MSAPERWVAALLRWTFFKLLDTDGGAAIEIEEFLRFKADAFGKSRNNKGKLSQIGCVWMCIADIDWLTNRWRGQVIFAGKIWCLSSLICHYLLIRPPPVLMSYASNWLVCSDFFILYLMTATHWHVKFTFQEFDLIDSVVFVEVASVMIDSVALGLRGFAILSAGAEVFDGLLLGYKSLDGVSILRYTPNLPFEWGTW